MRKVKLNTTKATKATKAKAAKKAVNDKAAKKAIIAKKANEENCSLGYAKLLVTIETLEAKADKTQHEYARLANCRHKVESKTISKVFKTLKDVNKAAKQKTRAKRQDAKLAKAA